MGMLLDTDRQRDRIVGWKLEETQLCAVPAWASLNSAVFCVM